MKKIILTAHHKNDLAIPIFKKYFNPIQVGSILNEVNLGIERDDSGLNISHKNKNYCELTAYYYAYKNLEFDYAGLMHYRRVFSTRKYSLSDFSNFSTYFMRLFLDLFSVRDVNLYLENNLKVSSLKNLERDCGSFYNYLKVQEFDIIVPKKVRYAYLNISNQYAINHCGYQLDRFNRITMDKYPEFAPVITKVLQRKKIYPYNMFVMKRKFFMNYHEMLFNVLNEMEEYVDLNSMNSYQARIFGFLSERFLNYYIELVRQKENVRINELRTIFLKDDIS